MPLTWQLDQIADYKQVCWIKDEKDDTQMNPVTHALIFGTMAVGLGSITDKNIDEFVARFRIMEKVDGAFVTSGSGEPHYLSDQEFIAHIGLATNVSTETRSQWTRRMFGNEPTSVTNHLAYDFRSKREKAAA